MHSSKEMREKRPLEREKKGLAGKRKTGKQQRRMQRKEFISMKKKNLMGREG